MLSSVSVRLSISALVETNRLTTSAPAIALIELARVKNPWLDASVLDCVLDASSLSARKDFTVSRAAVSASFSESPKPMNDCFNWSTPCFAGASWRSSSAMPPAIASAFSALTPMPISAFLSWLISCPACLLSDLIFILRSTSFAMRFPVDTYEQIEFCPACQKKTRHYKRRTNHILHIILSVLTAGLWLFVWAWYGLTNRWYSQCTECGRTCT